MKTRLPSAQRRPKPWFSSGPSGGICTALSRPCTRRNGCWQKGAGVWGVLQELMDQAGELGERIHALERGEIGELNHAIEDLRRQERRLQREKNDAQLAANEVRPPGPVGRARGPVRALGRAAGAAGALGGGGRTGWGGRRAARP